MKAVIPVAGLGTRMLPATKAIPKEMLPIVDKPIIQHVVNEAVKAGIKEIVLVTHSSKNSIENHFDTSFELEATLAKRVKRQLLSEIRSIIPEDVTIIHVRQGEAKGLGHAIYCAKPCIGDAPFVVLLPDVLISEFKANLHQENLSAMVRRFNQTNINQVMVQAVAKELVYKYGIADCKSNQPLPGQSAEVYNFVEKPKVEEAPSNLAIVGRYVFSPIIWQYLAATQADSSGEIQLTDAITALMQTEMVEAYHLLGKSYDCGDKSGYMLANFDYSLHHSEVAPAVGAWIRQQADLVLSAES